MSPDSISHVWVARGNRILTLDSSVNSTRINAEWFMRFVGQWPAALPAGTWPRELVQTGVHWPPLMTVDPAVRSIRIATTLNERFGAILTEAASPQTVAEFELKIGEAQQLYPEIWRHLDEARAALGQRGIGVPAYDALRTTEQPGQLAVNDIEASEGINPLSLAFGQLQYVQTKTASFNHEGHDKARQACDALMQAMPEIDWRAVSRAEDEEIAAMGSLTSSKWRQVAVVAAVILATFLAFRLLA